MFVVYKIENKLNGKLYIGSTCNVESRWKHHKQYAKDKKHYTKHPLYAAMYKYGLENFSFTIVKDTFDTKEQMEEYEVYLINKYNTTNRSFGYNLVAAAGTDLARLNCRAANSHIKQKCCLIDEANNIIEQYDSYQEAARKTNIDASIIRRVCKGIISSINSKLFRDLDELGRIVNIPQKTYKGRKAVVAIPIDGSTNYLYFESISAAANNLNYNRQSIQNCIQGNYRYTTVGNYIFRLIENNNIVPNNINIDTIIATKNKKYLINDKYYTKKEICEAFNIKIATLNARIRNGDSGLDLIRGLHRRQNNDLGDIGYTFLPL